jgi:hypothetical protein
VGCSTHLSRPDHHLFLKAPDKVVRGEDFHFTLTVTDAAGHELPNVVFYWWVSWVGLEGSHHKAKSGISQHLLVKGGPGTGVLHILGEDEEGTDRELASKTFQVE